MQELIGKEVYCLRVAPKNKAYIEKFGDFQANLPVVGGLYKIRTVMQYKGRPYLSVTLDHVVNGLYPSVTLGEIEPHFPMAMFALIDNIKIEDVFGDALNE
jgi:hypothetical protein